MPLTNRLTQINKRLQVLEEAAFPQSIQVIYRHADETHDEALRRSGVTPGPSDLLVLVTIWADGPP